jgi:hypothetical protein
MIPFPKRSALLMPAALVVLSACAHRAVRESSSQAYVHPAPPAAREVKSADPYADAARYAKEAERSSKEDEESSKSFFSDPPMWAGGIVILGILIAIIAVFG